MAYKGIDSGILLSAFPVQSEKVTDSTLRHDRFHGCQLLCRHSHERLLLYTNPI
jgi:hypothetical protein